MLPKHLRCTDSNNIVGNYELVVDTSGNEQ
jgi:hypothetical protein